MSCEFADTILEVCGITLSNTNADKGGVETQAPAYKAGLLEIEQLCIKHKEGHKH